MIKIVEVVVLYTVFTADTVMFDLALKNTREYHY